MSKSNNPNGRPKGSPNKATKEIREVLTSAISNEIPHMVECLERLRTSDDKTYINAMAKLIAFVVPKPQEIELKSDQLPAEITFNVIENK